MTQNNVIKTKPESSRPPADPSRRPSQQTQPAGPIQRLSVAAHKAMASVRGTISRFVTLAGSGNIGHSIRQQIKYGYMRLKAARFLPATGNSGRHSYKLGSALVILTLLSSLATYFILTNLTPIKPTNEVVGALLMISLLLVLIMCLVIAWQVVDLWRARNRNQAGARLHIKIVTWFSLIATLPAILLAVFASIHLDNRLDRLFSNRTNSIIADSLKVAQAYVNEHGEVLRTDTLTMAGELSRGVRLMQSDPRQFYKLLKFQADLRGIAQAYLIDGQGKVLASTLAAPAGTGFRKPGRRALVLAKTGRTIVFAPDKRGMVRAIKKLDGFANTYLYVLRKVNPTVVHHFRRARANIIEYKGLSAGRTGVQIAFGLMYVSIALSLLLSAVWTGLWFANNLVTPIRSLISASQEVARGNLAVSVPVRTSDGDLGLLGQSFNVMTGKLAEQHKELKGANKTLDERRRFIEAVLYGVTAGVIGVSPGGLITLANRSALKLLKREEAALTGELIQEKVPEFAKLFEAAREHRRGRADGQVDMFVGQTERNFAIRIIRESQDDKIDGYVITFDDITELVSAQRTSAWADVARRIAHEIKNPLTPIQLSAERIRRKYGKLLTDDREVFDKCTDTIIRQVGDIGRMVEEFSSFARMPKPEMELHNVRNLVRDAVVLFQMSHSEISITTHLPDKPFSSLVDRRLISQAVTNLVKNASEAIESHLDNLAKQGIDATGYRGRIRVELTRDEVSYAIIVTDNGCGLPRKNRSRLTEPYMTTRVKGTGLGLAIVKKITEQHHGQLVLTDAPPADGTAVVHNGRDKGAELADAATNPAIEGPGARVMLKLPLIAENGEQLVRPEDVDPEPDRKAERKADNIKAGARSDDIRIG